MAEVAAKKQYEEDHKRIEAVIIGYEQGYVSYHNVKLIRMKGKNLNLLLMVDYMPTLGEIDGRVELLCEEHMDRKGNKGATQSIVFDNVSGFFVIKNNVFKLLLKEENNAV